MHFLKMVNTFVTTMDKDALFDDLDDKRLGKQRLEAAQIIKILEVYDETGNFSGGYSKHPALQMWKGHTDALKAYFNLCVLAWIKRGFKNTYDLYPVDHERYRIVPGDFDGTTTTFDEEFDEYCFPKWFGFPPLILSHRAALLRKNPTHYASFDDDLTAPYYHRGYLWPHKHGDVIYEEWDFKYLDPIGAGAPAHFRISREDAMAWSENKNQNPKTRRAIKSTGPIYKDYQAAYIYYINGGADDDSD